MAARSCLFLLLLCSACSWEYHRSHYRYPMLNPQPGEFYVLADSISSLQGADCLRQQYFIKKGDWLHMSAYRFGNKWRIDSAFDDKGRVYLLRKNHEARTATYLYDTTFTLYLDKEERPIKHYININKPDTSYQYWQYYDENGLVEKEKRPIIYTLLAD